MVYMVYKGKAVKGHLIETGKAHFGKPRNEACEVFNAQGRMRKRVFGKDDQSVGIRDLLEALGVVPCFLRMVSNSDLQPKAMRATKMRDRKWLNFI